MSVAVPASAEMAMDRLVSASSVQDAVETLKSILEGFQSKPSTDDVNGEQPLEWQSAWIWQHEEMTEHLVYLLQHSQLKSNQAALEDDEGITVILKLYLEHLAKDSQALTLPASGSLLDALLDVMDPASQRPTYTRVLSLHLLEKLCQNHTSLAHRQWLQAPNALHRLADTITADMDNPLQEPVRTGALQVAQLLATSAPMAKVFLFAELDIKLLDMGWRLYGGLTGGNPSILDILTLIQELVRHADANLLDLLWQRPSLAPRLAQLVDLRGGQHFLHPDQIPAKSSTSNGTTSSSKKASTTSKPSVASHDDDDDDDLDALLNTGSKKAAATPWSEPETPQETPKEEVPTNDDLPHLLPAEEQVVTVVLDIIDRLLESDTLRPTVWKQHQGLCSLVWELALLQPARPPVCALASPGLQQRALELVAQKFHDPTTMDRHSGLDRLLYLVCTGGGAASSLLQRMGISQAALAVLRNVLAPDRIHEILLHTLAPPPMSEEKDNPMNAPGPTVIQKLWNTIAENVGELVHPTPEGKAVSQDQRTLFLSGALGGLSVFLVDAESREMVFKVTPEPASLDHMLEVLAMDATGDASSSINPTMQWSLYRFLCEYISDTPRLVQTLLQCTASTHLATLANPKRPTAPMVYLLLGLAMEHYPQDVTECGGWTPASILQVLQAIGISKVTKLLEGFKKTSNKDLSWATCELESKHWENWYQKAVWVVRKRIVRELTGSSAGGEDEEDTVPTMDGVSSNDLAGLAKSAGGESLQRLVVQQSAELDELREQLEQAQAKVSSQSAQLETWQRRMQSTPNELDGMLSELTDKTAKLELEIVSLKQESKQTQKAHEDEVVSMEQQLAEMRDVVAESKRQEQEAQEDRDRMEQELQALSQAYSSLEEEYRQSSNNGNAHTDPATPGAVTTPQPGADSVSSTEVSTLKAENTRLRSDAKAADEWMAMAVKKMNEMGTSQSQLSTQVKSLQEQLAASQQALANATSQQENMQQLQSEEQSMRHKVQTLEQQLSDSQQAELTLREQLESAQSQFQMNLDASLESAKATWEAEKERLEREKVELLQQLDEARNTTHPGEGLGHPESDEIARCENEIREKDTEIERLTQEILNTSHADEDSSDDVAVLQRQITALTHELSEVVRKSDEAIYKKESIIRELEGRLSNGVAGPCSDDDIRARDEEIAELQAANTAAQEWMEKAVEHHKLLQDQVASLTAETTRLKAAEKDYQSAASSALNEASVKLMESELSAKDEQLKILQSEVATKENDLAALHEELTASQNTSENLGIAREEVQLLQKQLDESRKREAELEESLSKKGSSEEVEGLRKENEDLESQLTDMRSWADMVQQKIGELLSAKKSAESSLAEAQLLLAAKDSQLSDLQDQMAQKDASDLPPETEADHSVIDQLQLELKRLEESNSEISAERDSLQDKLSSLEAAFTDLCARNDESQRQIEELRSVSRSEETNSPGMSAVQELHEGDIRPSFSDAEDFFGGATSATVTTTEGGQATSDSVRDGFSQDLQRKVEELESALSSLSAETSAKLEESNSLVSYWQDLHANASATISQLETEMESLRNSDVANTSEKSPANEEANHLKVELDEAQKVAEESEEVIREWEDKVAELEERVSGLESQLEEEQSDANETISQWQVSYTDMEERCESLEKELALLLEKHSEKESQNGVSEPACMDSPANEDAFAVFASTPPDAVAGLSLNEVPGHKGSMSPASNSELQQEISSLQDQLQSKEREYSEKIKELGFRATAAEMEAKQRSEQYDALLPEKDSLVRDFETDSNNYTTISEKDRLEDEVKILHEKLDRISDPPKEGTKELEVQLEEKIAERNAATDDLAQAESVMKQWEERVEELEAELDSMNDRLAEQQQEAEAAIMKWQDTVWALEERCKLAESHMEGDDQTHGQTESLSQGITVLEDRLPTSSNEENPEQSHGEIESLRSKIADLEDRLKGSDNVTASDDQAEFEGVVRQWEARVEELESELDSLNLQLLEQQQDTEATIAQWQGNLTSLEERCMLAESQLAGYKNGEETSQNEIESLHEKITELEGQLYEARQTSSSNHIERVAELEQTISVLRGEMEAQRDEGVSTLEELKAKLHTVMNDVQDRENDIMLLRLELDSRGTSENEKINKLRGDLADEREQRLAAQSEAYTLRQSLDDLSASLDASRSESEEVVSMWTARVEELESQLQEVEEQLADQAGDANAAIESWEQKADELERDLEIVNEELAQARLKLQEQDSVLADMNTQLADKSHSIEELEKQKSSITEGLEIERQQLDVVQKQLEDLKLRLATAESTTEKLRDERDRLKSFQESKTRDKLEEDRDRLTVVIAQLEEELQEANSVLQTYVTDDSFNRATEVAAQALRDEIEDLKNQVEEYRQLAEDERINRETSALEIDRLRDEIAALVSLNSQDVPSDELQQRTAKAVERLKMKERIEIVQLKKSLFRTIEEVEVARAAEKEANEQLAKARLQTSVSEQDVVSVKSEVNFLTQALEELRLSEEDKRTSLQYRIGTLEDENDVLRKYHFTELESLRNELSQMTMEKDRILNQLRESEKSHSAFKLGASSDGSDQGDGDLDSEVKRLRTENAYLLNVAADDKARAERRLREVLAAHRATAEADTILEHELRVAAESTIQTLKSQLEDMGKSGRGGPGPHDQINVSSGLGENMADELVRLKEEVSELEKENNGLKTRMEHMATKAKSEISALTEEWRRAQSKARQLEREGRFDSDVQTEVDKLRISPEKRAPPMEVLEGRKLEDELIDSDDPASELPGNNVLSAEAYDMICKQREEMQEERKMYLEILAEHDNLLALLAQQDLERSCLKDALVDKAGPEVVEKVLQDVEEKALAQFGNFVKVI
eukprot:Nitzschia sp. Nitz4//scaffold160_size51814//6417//15104//NITZ4_006908-RA/size51814-augustus-gene-0.69-mRNA-1//-1//CDS//3329537839//1698//frame0